MMPERYAKITGWGKYVPERVLTNHDLAQMVDTSDEWITTRTGIKERRIRTENDTNVQHVGRGGTARRWTSPGITAKDLDLIIVATSSPDYLVPSVASQVQDMLGADVRRILPGGRVFGLGVCADDSQPIYYQRGL